MPKKPSKSERASPYWKYGTDAEYQAWCRTQPSAYSSSRGNDALGHIVYAHYRTAKTSGTGFKPPYSGIPLTWAEHALQHQIGQVAFMPKDRWEFLVNLHLERWINSHALHQD